MLAMWFAVVWYRSLQSVLQILTEDQTFFGGFGVIFSEMVTYPIVHPTTISLWVICNFLDFKWKRMGQ